MPDSTCLIDGCERPQKSRDWCHAHYEYLRSRGELPAKACKGCGGPCPGARHYCSEDCKPQCAVEGCEELRRTKDWCTFHFTRWKLAGDPEAPLVKTVYESGLNCAFPGCVNKRRKYELCTSHDTQRRRGQELAPLTYKSRGYVCQFCAGPSGLVKGYRRFCSSRCARMFRRHEGPLPETFTCLLCNGDFPYVVEGQRRKKADTKMCNQCRLASAKHGYSPTQLAQRDGLACGLCGDRVDLDLIYPDLMRGSVDHIIPTSLGGSNEPENVQLAHLHCNIKKNNRVEVPSMR